MESEKKSFLSELLSEVRFKLRLVPPFFLLTFIGAIAMTAGVSPKIVVPIGCVLVAILPFIVLKRKRAN